MNHLSDDQIAQQVERLRFHRNTLAHYLNQLAISGAANVRPEVTAGIREARHAITRIKGLLAEVGAAVADHPDDLDPIDPQPASGATPTRSSESAPAIAAPPYPITPTDWLAELTQRTEIFGKPLGYWCYTPDGMYQVGGWAPTTPGAIVRLAPFWIARYPITIAQFAAFVDAGGIQPWWGHASAARADQPAIGISLDQMQAFCHWLTHTLNPHLPGGYMLRLPTEAEWEVAATYTAQGQRRTYPWGKDLPTPDRAIYRSEGRSGPAPVGSCPSGAAPNGALDMAGNVWEVTLSRWSAYPQRSAELANTLAGDYIPLRGGSWWDDMSFLHCASRDRLLPGLRGHHAGFRLVLSPN